MNPNVILESVRQTKPKSDNEKTEAADPFYQSIEILVLAANSLYDGIPLSMATLTKAHIRSRKAVQEFIKPYIPQVEDGQQKPSSFDLNLPNVKVVKFRRLRQQMKRSSHAIRAISESFLVALVTQYDTFIGALARSVLEARPETLNASDKVLTFRDLKTFSSVEDARSFLIEKEVDELLRGSHVTQLDWFEKRLPKGKEKLSARLGPWPEFIEVSERRNVIIHSDSVVSKQYVQECEKAGLKQEQVPTLGTSLGVTPSYYAHAYEVVIEVALRLGFIMWINTDKQEGDLCVKRLIDLSLDFLSEEHSNLASRLFEFGSDLAEQFGDESTKKTMAINLCQAYKWQGDEQKMRATLAKHDFSGSDNTFHLGVAVLEGDWVQTEHYMRRIAKLDDLHPNAYREWPLFRGLRKEERFLKLFEELYKDPLIELEN